jgi:hypothetical protein
MMKTKRQFLATTIASLCALTTKTHAKEVDDANLPESMKKEIVLRALIETISLSRETVVLSDGSVWEVDPMCSVAFVMWMEMDEVAVIAGRTKHPSLLYKFTMVNFRQNRAISVRCVRLATR